MLYVSALYLACFILALRIITVDTNSLHYQAKVLLSSPQDVDISKSMEASLNDLHLALTCGVTECELPSQFCDSALETVMTCRSCETWCASSGEVFCKRQCPLYWVQQQRASRLTTTQPTHTVRPEVMSAVTHTVPPIYTVLIGLLSALLLLTTATICLMCLMIRQREPAACLTCLFPHQYQNPGQKAPPTVMVQAETLLTDIGEQTDSTVQHNTTQTVYAQPVQRMQSVSSASVMATGTAALETEETELKSRHNQDNRESHPVCPSPHSNPGYLSSVRADTSHSGGFSVTHERGDITTHSTLFSREYPGSQGGTSTVPLLASHQHSSVPA